MEIISICLSDIPKESRTTANNGKIYASFVVDKRREPDQFGNTHTIYINQTKDERMAKKNKIYVGNGKEYIFENREQQAPIQNNQQPEPFDDGLPF